MHDTSPDGTRISIDDPDALKFRRSVIEWLMLNHPHDCPVCDEGGECHLQDMTVMTGHVYRRSRFKKRTYNNQYLGPFLNHEMNRCIQCYRCVRFYRDYAGGRDLNVFGAHDHVYFGRHEEGVLESEFSGNLIEVCPTGVFTDRTLKKHYTRKWDLQTAPSVCVHCGLGCNTIPGERYGKLRRVHNRYNGEVNGYFLCDRGRYGYEFVNSERRIHKPLLTHLKEDSVNMEHSANPVGKDIILRHLSDILYFGAKVIGIGSPRASLEANFALRTLVGPDHFYSGISETEYRLVSLITEIMQNGPARSPSLHDVEIHDAVLVLGEDITNVAPMLDLAVRQSVRQKPLRLSDNLGIPRWHDHAIRDAIQDDKGPLFTATPAGTKLDAIATKTYHAPPDDIARLGFAVAHALDGKAPQISDLAPDVQDMARTIAHALMESEKPLIISGVSCNSESVIRSAANIAWALCGKGVPAGLSFIVHEYNTTGLGLMRGNSLNEAFRTVKNGGAETAIILENDLYRRTDKETADDFFKNCKHTIAIDSIETQTTSKAEIVLPASAFAETDGTIVNNEGRAQRFFKVFHPIDNIQESWRWVLDMMTVAERPEAYKWRIFEDITSAMAETIPIFKLAAVGVPPAGFRIAGMKIPRQPHRYSGRTAMHADISVHESKPPGDPDSPLSFSMEGYEGAPPSSLITRFWAPGWNSVQAVNKFQNEIGGRLLNGDPGRRLIEPETNKDILFFNEVPSAFNPMADEFLVVPLYHIFGSEEFSALSPGIAELAPKPYFGLNPDAIKKLNINEGAIVGVTLNGAELQLPVKCIINLSQGTAGVPVGLPGLIGLILPASVKIQITKHTEGPNG